MAKSEAYNMDCMEALKKFPDKYFDLAVVDPPYGDGVAERERERERAGTGSVSDSTGTRFRIDHLPRSCRERERERDANAKSSRLRIAEGGQSAGLVEPGRRSSEKNH